MLIGLGTFFIWLRTLKLFEGIHPFDIFSRTLIIAAPTFGKVAVGVLPFIVGSGFLAQILFWKSHDMFTFYFRT
jgi:Polycystin cation channel